MQFYIARSIDTQDENSPLAMIVFAENAEVALKKISRSGLIPGDYELEAQTTDSVSAIGFYQFEPCVETFLKERRSFELST